MIKIVDFFAKWCKPCKTYDVILPELAQEYGFEIEKIDVEEHAEQLKDWNIQGLPTLLIMVDDEPKGMIVGAYGKSRLVQKIGEFLGYSLDDTQDVPIEMAAEREFSPET